MKACDVQIGGEYTAKINKEKVAVRITAKKSGGGWSAINTATNKKVFISDRVPPDEEVVRQAL